MGLKPRMTDPELVAPAHRYRQSFIEAVREFQADTFSLNSGMGRYRKIPVADLEADFDAHLRELEAAAREESATPDFVPETTFWLVDGGKFVGRVSIRHRLNDQLMRIGGQVGYEIRPSKRRQGYGTLALRLALPKARSLGLAKVLLTCDSTNTPSRKIIERSGGIFENAVSYSPEKPPKHRYWIEIAGGRPPESGSAPQAV